METIIYGWDRERGQSSLLLGPVAFITILSFLKFCSVSLEEWNELLVLYSLGFFNEKVHKKKDSQVRRQQVKGRKKTGHLLMFFVSSLIMSTIVCSSYDSTGISSECTFELWYTSSFTASAYELAILQSDFCLVGC